MISCETYWRKSAENLLQFKKLQAPINIVLFALILENPGGTDLCTFLLNQTEIC